MSKLMGLMMLAVGGLNVVAGLAIGGEDLLHLFRTGAWRPFPLATYVPLQPHFSSAPAQQAAIWVLNSPVSVWAMIAGAYVAWVGARRIAA